MPRRRPAGAQRVVHRSARVALETTPAQRRRCFSQLASAGDVRACVLELNEVRRQRGNAPIASYQALCRALSSAGPGCLGELSSTAARSVLRRDSDAWFAAARARTSGDIRARFPRRRRRLVGVRFSKGTFSLWDRALTVPAAKDCAPLRLRLRLARPAPYPGDQIRSATLLCDDGRLVVEVAAEVPVEDHGLDPRRVRGADPGIIYPFALAWGDKAVQAGIAVVLVTERRTSSRCPACGAHIAARGRNFRCTSCTYAEQRDVVGARNIAAKGGGTTSTRVLVTHRRVGRHLPGRTRRDPRRVRMGQARGPWPAVARPDRFGESLACVAHAGEEPQRCA